MPTINQLSALDALSGGDNLPLYSPTQGDARRASLTLLAQWMAANMDAVAAQSLTAAAFSRVVPVSVANLPGGLAAGARAVVTDANATLTAGIGAVVAGGGANTVPVFFDGTDWRIG